MIKASSLRAFLCCALLVFFCPVALSQTSDDIEIPIDSCDSFTDSDQRNPITDGEDIGDSFTDADMGNPNTDDNDATFSDGDMDTPKYKQGDINGDGIVSIKDLTILIKIILGKERDTLKTADVNKDKAVNLADIDTLVNIICSQIGSNMVHYLMYIKLSDGTNDVYRVSDHPVVTFDSEHIRIKTDKIDVKYSMNDVSEYRFDKADGTDVKSSIKVDEKTRYAVQYVDNEHVVVRGAKAADHINVYSVDGQKVSSAVNSANDGVVVSLEGLTQNQYMFNIEDKVSAKILKK